MTEENTNVNETETVAAPSLSLQDLAAVVQIIDICSKRGAFEGSELEAVGAVRGRFAAFVQANKPAEEQEVTEESEESEEA